MSPMPKPAGARRRRNPPAMATVHVPATARAGVIEWGEPDPEWHPLAQETYRNLAASQQAALAQPSDIALAKFACLAMTRCLGMTKFSGITYKSVCETLNDLGATLGSRLRLRLDLEPSAGVTGAEATAARLREMFAGEGGARQAARILKLEGHR